MDTLKHFQQKSPPNFKNINPQLPESPTHNPTTWIDKRQRRDRCDDSANAEWVTYAGRVVRYYYKYYYYYYYVTRSRSFKYVVQNVLRLHMCIVQCEMQPGCSFDGSVSRWRCIAISKVFEWVDVRECSSVFRLCVYFRLFVFLF